MAKSVKSFCRSRFSSRILNRRQIVELAGEVRDPEPWIQGTCEESSEVHGAESKSTLNWEAKSILCIFAWVY